MTPVRPPITLAALLALLALPAPLPVAAQEANAAPAPQEEPNTAAKREAATSGASEGGVQARDIDDADPSDAPPRFSVGGETGGDNTDGAETAEDLAPLSPEALAQMPPAEAWRAVPETLFDARDIALEDFKWIARPVIVFADSPADPRFTRQLDLLADRVEDLAVRDIVLITDTDPAAATETRLKLRPRGFMLVAMAKDGTVILRKPFPWDVRELTRVIDKMPLRQQEMRERRQINK